MSDTQNERVTDEDLECLVEGRFAGPARDFIIQIATELQQRRKADMDGERDCEKSALFSEGDVVRMVKHGRNTLYTLKTLVNKGVWRSRDGITLHEKDIMKVS